MVTEDLAAQWRVKNGYVGRGGVVVVFDGVACGWVNKLRNPDHWRIGAIAVDEAGAKWKASGVFDWGGDDTATHWSPFDGA